LGVEVYGLDNDKKLERIGKMRMKKESSTDYNINKSKVGFKT